MVTAFRQPPPPDLSRGRSFTRRQSDILEALEDLFLRRGFRAVTIQELAAYLHCSRRTLYELAPTKDELVLLVIDRLMQRTGRKAMMRLQGLEDPVQRVHAYVSTASHTLRPGQPGFSDDVAAHPAAHRLFRQHYRFAVSVVAGLIQDGIDTGLLPGANPQLVAEVLYAGLERLEDPEVLRVTGLSNADAIQQLFDLVIYGLARGRGQHTRPEVG